MKQLITRSLLMTGLIITLMAHPARAQVNGDAITGEWATSDKTAHVLIYKQGGKFYGKLILIHGDNGLDDKNPIPH